MSLKLFRSTGYSSLLSPGRSRATLHPGWVVLGASLWAGFACNVPLWRAVAGAPLGLAMLHALLLGTVVASGCAVALSLFGWYATLKPAATLILVVAALAAVARWNGPPSLDASLIDSHLTHGLLPSWASLLRWQVSALLALLVVVPLVWVWNAPVRRLPGPRQLRSNLVGMASAAVVFAATASALYNGLG
ncbi:phosphoethanolamine transferase domain-containing protein [Caenimonas aquaedulcis]|uniref:DUF1705 domain-containing protein n=1 Tax=Caenimonas aquaedulcis TaxID=2793270 RepID=A0A931MFK4_9BURK|nr:phosphoethanolamine transferase domain-containing protein [Caenimonas aquaedulcis]MBG9386555.1 DUF1705 domain-containing protein [Caenimonas aquaedulcis]